MKSIFSFALLISLTTAQIASAQYNERHGRNNDSRYDRSQRSDSVVISSVSRKTNGSWYRVFVQNQVRLDRITISPQAAKVKIHEISLITSSRQRQDVSAFRNSSIIAIGASLTSEYISSSESIIAIDIRAESYGGYSNIVVSAESSNGRPSLSLSENDYQAPPTPPNNPIRPPTNSYGRDLRGYCQDYDHSQFYRAKEFAYSSAGINLTSTEATNWALNYNKTHACGTIEEYRSRFVSLYDYAYSSASLNMTSTEARQYAIKNVENLTANEVARMKSLLIEAKNFAYSSATLNYTSAEATAFARRWVESRCEDESIFSHLRQRFSQEYNFAYSSNGLNYTSAEARRYAVRKIQPLTRCGYMF